MKTRAGFVSNSSSSSFIVAFERLPESVEDLKQMLWGDKKVLVAYDDGVTTEDAAEVIWADIQGQIDRLPYQKDDDEITREFDSLGYHLQYEERCKPGPLGFGLVSPPHDYNETKEEREARWKREQDRGDELAKQHLDEFWDKHGDKVILLFNYEDHGTMGCTLEHGPTFDALPHKRINHH